MVDGLWNEDILHNVCDFIIESGIKLNMYHAILYNSIYKLYTLTFIMTYIEKFS